MSLKESCRVDLHIHSCLSPCAHLLNTPGNIIKRAVKLGLDCIAITDHNTAGNIPIALELAKGTGVNLIPAMEVETREEVHVLCYFPTLEALLAWDSIVKEHLPDLDNNEEFFGHQLLTDYTDQYIAKEGRLLAVATGLSLSDTVSAVTKLGGIAVPAHVDRPTNSILSQLGFIPRDIEIRILELSSNRAMDDYLRTHPELDSYLFLQGSDSHYLTDIGKCGGGDGFNLGGELGRLMSRFLEKNFF